MSHKLNDQVRLTKLSKSILLGNDGTFWFTSPNTATAPSAGYCHQTTAHHYRAFDGFWAMTYPFIETVANSRPFHGEVEQACPMRISSLV
jgi:hypothetical protein